MMTLTLDPRAGKSFRHACVAVMRKDREEQGDRPLSHYLEQFPGHDVAVARAYVEVFGGCSEEEGESWRDRDALTQTLTRHALEESLSTLCQQVKLPDGDRLGLLLLDLDGFKEVNDRDGHQAGDAVLRAVSRLIVMAAKQVGKVYRYGGDEFVVLVPGGTVERLEALANNVRRAVGGTLIPTLRGQARVTVSAGGVSVAPGSHNATRDRLLAFADRMLYQAKHGGRDIAFVSEWRG